MVCNFYDMSLEGVQVDIRPEWSVLEQIPLTSLSKLSYDVGEPEDMYGLPSILDSYSIPVQSVFILNVLSCQSQFF